MRDDIIGGYRIGEFHHDPTDDSHFWVETNTETGEERLGNTGPHREALYINGKYILPAEVLHLPVETDIARERYLEVGQYFISLINKNRQPDN